MIPPEEHVVELPASWGGKWGSNGPGETKTNQRRRKVQLSDRQVIAWDMEGMSLSGQSKPQHAVLFGSSAMAPIIGRDLGAMAMIEHILQVDREHPNALHVGYGWRYDATMLVKDFPLWALKILWEHGRLNFRTKDFEYRLRWLPGKWVTVSRNRAGKRRGRHYDTGDSQSVTIYDYSSFFGGTAFLEVCEQILGDDLTVEDRKIIAEGKQARGDNGWGDLPEVVAYWTAEIQLIRRVMERFRDIMFAAGFALKDWYGPGALANHIIASRKLRQHLRGAQRVVWQGNTPYINEEFPHGAHEAVKRAFAGGRFEQFQVGRVEGPVNVWDINAAYPHALTMIPSLAEGRWDYVSNPEKIERFGVYHIDWRDPNHTIRATRPQPLFMRNRLGLISFPQMVSGWYMSPEALIAHSMKGAKVSEGYVWKPATDDLPFAFLNDMYATRQRLGKDNLASLPFKLGPNSLYGKLAQTVGWSRKYSAPPKSHALAVAAWTTSYCRAMLFSAISRAPDKVIAVETDSIVTTATPKEMALETGPGLGRWSHSSYDEIVYVQSGIYQARRGDEWVATKRRGLDRTDVSRDRLMSWLATLGPDSWEPLVINTRPRFIGLGTALMTMRPGDDSPASLASWRSQERIISAGRTGKRIHDPATCPMCEAGISPTERAHPLFVTPWPEIESQPRMLPWENEYPRAVVEIREEFLREGLDLGSDG